MTKTLKILASILNLGLLGFVLFILITEDIDSGDWEAILMLSGLVAAPVINLIYILLFTKESENWVTLYLKRKALEEKKKIAKLKD